VQRLEVITGAGGRRRWSAAEKARITEEAMVPGAVISEVARRHGMSPQHLFTWRRLAVHRAGLERAETPLFVPAMIEAPAEQPAPKRRARRRSSGSGIELEIGGVVVRVGSDASPKAIAAVIRALKAVP
jgi:transposase